MPDHPRIAPLDPASSAALIADPEGGLPRLLEIMRRLRDPATGCPWDIEQDFASIAPYTIEEAHEVADAIQRAAWDELEGELGDLLLQTVYHAQMGAEAGLFDFTSVTRSIADKMVARHPHVFGTESRDKSSAQQTADWERIKASERAGKAQGRVLDGVALGLPALTRAVKLQKRAATVGFDWPGPAPVIEKLKEELEEVRVEFDALAAAPHSAEVRDRLEDELGDLLFVAANLARHAKVDPGAAMRRANHKFERRFRAMETMAAADGVRLADLPLDAQDAYWNRVKAAEAADADTGA